MATISAVDTSTDEQNSEIVMVNHPWVHQGHYIYLESFDPMMGVVLRISVDRWLWLAYLVLWMLIGGAMLMFITGQVGFVYQPIESEKMKSKLKNKRL